MPANVAVAAVPTPRTVISDMAITAPTVPAGAVPADPAISIDDRPHHDGAIDDVRTAVPIVSSVATRSAPVAGFGGTGRGGNRTEGKDGCAS